MKEFLPFLRLALACAVLGSASAHATVVTWNLQDVAFDDGSFATGSFSYDAATDTYSGWDIKVAAASFMPAYDYLQGVDGGFLGIHSATAADFVAFPPATPGRYIRLTFVSALTDLGGIIDLVTGGPSFECNNCGTFRRIVDGQVTTRIAAVPEPATLTLLGLGLFGIAVVRRRVAGSKL